VSAPKIVIVTDWITDMGGQARVDLALHEAFPTAPIYASVYEPDEFAKEHFKDINIHTTWLQKLPKPLRKFHKLVPMLRVKAFRDLDLSEFDIIISSSSAESKQVRKTRDDQVHISYCHTPIRYYWSHKKQYLRDPGFGLLNWPARIGLTLLLPSLRKADYSASQEVDLFIANSTAVQKRIKKYYDRNSTIVHPPIDAERFTKAAQPLEKRAGYVALGRQVPYKKIDLAVEACTVLGYPLTVLGNGSEHERLVKMAGPNIDFVTRPTDAEVAKYMGKTKGFIFPAEEDFGIVQVEALAAGTPVIAYGKGGSQDIIDNGKGGVTFRTQNSVSLQKALLEAENSTFKPDDLQRIAKRFHKTLFISKVKKIVRDNS